MAKTWAHSGNKAQQHHVSVGLFEQLVLHTGDQNRRCKPRKAARAVQGHFSGVFVLTSHKLLGVRINDMFHTMQAYETLKGSWRRSVMRPEGPYDGQDVHDGTLPYTTGLIPRAKHSDQGQY